MPSVKGQSHSRLEELVKGAAQLGTRELESLVARLLALRAQRVAPSLPQAEGQLLRVINQGLPAVDQQRYDELAAKLREETISSEEHRELLALIERIEHADAERIRALTNLAQLREIPVETLMNDLGIRSPAYG